MRAFVRVGVVLCVALAALAGLARLDEALGLFDYRADQNAARSYLDRLYGEPFNILGSQKVFLDARAWMPEDATYRVVLGHRKPLTVAEEVAPDYLRFLLLPRRQTESGSATWLICYGCDVSALGDRFEVLSKDGEILFGRARE